MSTCHARCHGQEWKCSRGFSWGIDDTPPTCAAHDECPAVEPETKKQQVSIDIARNLAAPALKAMGEISANDHAYHGIRPGLYKTFIHHAECFVYVEHNTSFAQQQNRVYTYFTEAGNRIMQVVSFPSGTRKRYPVGNDWSEFIK